MTTTAITTHNADALARILEEYKTAGNLKSIISKLADRTQELEDVFGDIKLSRSIADATDAQLESLGEIVGVERPAGVSDEVYRVIIFGTAAANSSDGTTEAVINTYRVLTQAQNVRMDEVYPAKVELFSDGEIDPDAESYIVSYLEKSLPAGVLLGNYGLFSGVAGFGFAENPAALGFGDLDDAAVGGGLGSLLGED